MRLPSVPEAVWRGSNSSVQKLSDDVVVPMSSVLAVLSPTEATRSSTLVSGDNLSATAAAAESDGSRLVPSDHRLAILLLLLKEITIYDHHHNHHYCIPLLFFVII